MTANRVPPGRDRVRPVFDDHPTRDVVPILVEDTARDVLRVMPTAGGRDRRRRDR